MQNEPNFRRRRGGRGHKAGGHGAIVRNKANLSIADCGLGTDLRRDACPAACPSRLCKTNPICGVNRAKQSQFLRRVQEWALARYAEGGAATGDQLRQTKPICLYGHGGGVVPRPIVQNEANFGGSFKCKESSVKPAKAGDPLWVFLLQTFGGTPAARSHLCKTNPICPHGREGGRSGCWGQSCETKPIRAGCHKRQVLCKKGVRLIWPPKGRRRNKANLPAGAGASRRSTSIARNEANVPVQIGGRSGGWCQSCETKPIRAGRHKRQVLCRKGVRLNGRPKGFGETKPISQAEPAGAACSTWIGAGSMVGRRRRPPEALRVGENS
jgi:hypothetical protein